MVEHLLHLLGGSVLRLLRQHLIVVEIDDKVDFILAYRLGMLKFKSMGGDQ
jgi:hypothetical protein